MKGKMPFERTARDKKMDKGMKEGSRKEERMDAKMHRGPMPMPMMKKGARGR